MPTPREEQPVRPDSRQAERAAGLNPAALSVTDTARTLTRVGGRPITEAMIERDIDDGAPTNADGTINLVHYAAWLVRDMAESASANGGARGD
ncbi:MAG: hypothetical protein KJZ69_01885 [Phycisphaerales bacterium]|nr:hypothetical protein [Phycisphaerales bacterium]